MFLSLLLAAMTPSTIQTPVLKSWEGLKYGMFIHYGMSTFDQTEINEGKSDPSVYNPTNLNVRQWVHVAKQAGMKYAVLTAKHTAGFCLWPSGDYDVSQSPVKTDVIAEFMKACKAEGVKPGIYYCVLDGHNEGGVKWDAAVTPDYFELIKKHLTQLHTRYPGILEQWIDIPGKLTPSQRQEIYDLIKKYDPNCLVLMNKSIEERPGTSMPSDAWPTDLVVGERHGPPTMHNPRMTVGEHSYYLPLEVCDCLRDNWFWVKGDKPRSVQQLYRIYRDSVGRGANLLLDVPPDMTGQIPQESVQRLMELKKVIANPTSLEASMSLTLDKLVTATNFYKNDPKYGPQNAVDGDDSTRWACDDSVHTATLEVELGSPETFNQAYISEAFPGRVKSFELQAMVGGFWRTFYAGADIGPILEVKFPPIYAHKVRLNILDSLGGPTIGEFQLFGPKHKMKNP